MKSFFYSFYILNAVAVCSLKGCIPKDGCSSQYALRIGCNNLIYLSHLFPSSTQRLVDVQFLSFRSQSLSPRIFFLADLVYILLSWTSVNPSNKVVNQQVMSQQTANHTTSVHNCFQQCSSFYHSCQNLLIHQTLHHDMFSSICQHHISKAQAFPCPIFLKS